MVDPGPQDEDWTDESGVRISIRPGMVFVRCFDGCDSMCGILEIDTGETYWYCPKCRGCFEMTPHVVD